jgi:hypothetical protein
MSLMSTPNPKTKDWAVRFRGHDTPVSLVAGQTVAVNLRLENVGSRKWMQSGSAAAHVGYRWFDAAGAQQRDVEDRRTALPADVYPRQEIAFGAVLVAPKAPGAYNLHWDLFGSAWFADTDHPPLSVPVRVTAAPTDITGWRVESNVNPAPVARALDGDPRTFWDSGVPQAAGQWFRLNLAAPRVVDGIQFLSPGKGFPAGYVLRVSADGRTWVEVARVAAGNQYDVMAVFAPQLVQYAQIDLLGVGMSSWMISEVLVHAGIAWHADASHNPKTACRAIDNRADTAWSSGAPQMPEMWFQIDLGHAEIVSGLTLVPPADEHPASYRVAVWNASAHRWQAVAEKLSQTELLDIVFDATQTQFVNIQLLQARERPWAIQHVGVSREMERWLGPGT